MASRQTRNDLVEMVANERLLRPVLAIGRGNVFGVEDVERLTPRLHLFGRGLGGAGGPGVAGGFAQVEEDGPGKFAGREPTAVQLAGGVPGASVCQMNEIPRPQLGFHSGHRTLTTQLETTAQRRRQENIA